MTTARPVILRRLSTIAIAIVMLIVGLAGAAKLVSLDEFSRSLAGWRVIPEASRVTLAIVIPSVELGLCSLWFLNRRRELVQGCTCVFLGTFVVVLSIERMLGSVPECNCFGVLEQYFQSLKSVRFTTYKSIALLVALVVSIITQRLSHASHGPSAHKACGPSRGGFTLVELLICIAVTAVLVAIIVPAVSGTKARAAQVRTAANLRSSFVVVTTYCDDWKDTLPAPKPTPSWGFRTVTDDGAVHEYPSYFLWSLHWVVSVLDRYLPRQSSEVLYSSEQLRGSNDGSGSPFMLPCTSIADPKFWNAATRVGVAQYRGVRRSEVLYPARKVALVDSFALFNGRGVSDDQMLAPLFDGSVSAKSLDRYLPGVSSGDGRFDGTFHQYDAWLAMHTIDGIRGLDVAD